ncbi:MAG: helix-turn-helix domain-containing protein [Chloroflexi bacterium]|nr:helix-turn-helix domain-containing protein [Chloroflexota bacterium]
MILLSADGFQIDEIARIFKVQRDTVSRCFQNWESKGIAGLFDSPKSDRPQALSPQGSERAIVCVTGLRENEIPVRPYHLQQPHTTMAKNPVLANQVDALLGRFFAHNWTCQTA